LFIRNYKPKLEKIRKPINGNLIVEEFGRKVEALWEKVEIYRKDAKSQGLGILFESLQL